MKESKKDCVSFSWRETKQKTLVPLMRFITTW